MYTTSLLMYNSRRHIDFSSIPGRIWFCSAEEPATVQRTSGHSFSNCNFYSCTASVPDEKYIACKRNNHRTRIIIQFQPVPDIRQGPHFSSTKTSAGETEALAFLHPHSRCRSVFLRTPCFSLDMKYARRDYFPLMTP